jgi:hypothetical protein
MRLVLESLKSLVLKLAVFFTFCDGQLLYYKNRHTVTVTNITTICIERHFFEAISIDNTKNLPLLSTFCHF